MLPRYDVLSHAFRIPYFFALLGGCTVRQSSLLPRNPRGGGKILCGGGRFPYFLPFLEGYFTAQQMPRFMISNTSGIWKSAATWPIEE